MNNRPYISEPKGEYTSNACCAHAEKKFDPVAKVKEPKYETKYHSGTIIAEVACAPTRHDAENTLEEIHKKVPHIAPLELFADDTHEEIPDHGDVKAPIAEPPLG